MSGKSQQESEAPAKVYQVDAIALSLAEIKTLIEKQTATYVTKESLALIVQELKGNDESQVKENKATNARINAWKKTGELAKSKPVERVKRISNDYETITTSNNYVI